MLPPARPAIKDASSNDNDPVCATKSSIYQDASRSADVINLIVYKSVTS